MSRNHRLEPWQVHYNRGLWRSAKIKGVTHIDRFAWSPGGDRLAIGYPDKTLEIVKVEAGRIIEVGDPGRRSLRLNIPNEYLHFNSISWSFDERLIAAAFEDADVRVWDVQTGECKTLSRHLKSVNCVAFSPTEKILLSAGSDRLLLLWDLKGSPLGYNSVENIRSFGGHHAEVNSVAWSQRGDMFASAGADGKLLLWSRHDERQRLLRQVAQVEYPINSVAWTESDVDLVTASGSPLIQIWSVQSDHHREATPEHPRSVRDARVSSYPLMASKSTRDNRVILWRTDKWSRVAEIIESRSEFYGPGPAFHPTERMLATLDEEGDGTVIVIWEFAMDYLFRPDAGRAAPAADGIEGIRERESPENYDVFLCYNSSDRETVVQIAQDLRRHGIRPFLDVWHLVGGEMWQNEIFKFIDKIRVAAIFLGPHGRGAWQDFEAQNLVSYAVERGYTIIPVFLPGYTKDTQNDPRLNAFQHVDFGQWDKEEPFDKLMRGILAGRGRDSKKS